MAPTIPEPEKPDWSLPKLLLKVNDLNHPGSARFFEHVHVDNALQYAVRTVLSQLYTFENAPKNVRSVTLVLREFDGVAYTTGSDLDDDHKEIHFSTKYIAGIQPVSETRIKDEIMGVLVHEMVHCFQYNGKGTCPGGLIEGIADFVRLRADLAPPHWSRGGSRWDEGYQVTGYFLDWIDERYGHGTVQELNFAMRDKAYNDTIFKDLTGRPLDKLWSLYKESLEEKRPNANGSPL